MGDYSTANDGNDYLLFTNGLFKICMGFTDEIQTRFSSCYSDGEDFALFNVL